MLLYLTRRKWVELQLRRLCGERETSLPKATVLSRSALLQLRNSLRQSCGRPARVRGKQVVLDGCSDAEDGSPTTTSGSWPTAPAQEACSKAPKEHVQVCNARNWQLRHPSPCYNQLSLWPGLRRCAAAGPTPAGTTGNSGRQRAAATAPWINGSLPTASVARLCVERRHIRVSVPMWATSLV
eukprot:scaffold21_cov368-Prasinococcus_capsulatus_cf.AAC.8